MRRISTAWVYLLSRHAPGNSSNYNHWMVSCVACERSEKTPRRAGGSMSARMYIASVVIFVSSERSSRPSPGLKQKGRPKIRLTPGSLQRRLKGNAGRPFVKSTEMGSSGAPTTVDYVNPTFPVSQPASRATPYYVAGDMTTANNWLVGDGERQVYN